MQGPLLEGEQAKIKVKARLNLHGLVTLENATELVEEDVEESASKADDTPMQVSRHLRTHPCSTTTEAMHTNASYHMHTVSMCRVWT